MPDQAAAPSFGPPPPPEVLHERRERVFLILAGIFLGTLAMLNILGISRFIKLGEVGGVPLAVAVGVLPYPVTFLCTDLISEFYGRRRAAWVVFVGLLLNVWVVAVLYVGGILPGFEELTKEGAIARDAAGRLPPFFEMRVFAFGAVGASMIAYLAAQLCDVFVFHFWKRVTRGKHLWLRNNGSTMVSQIVDTVAVILITYFATTGLDGVIKPDRPIGWQLFVLIASGYVFKFAAALIDTIPIYVAVHYLSRYLHIDPLSEHATDVEELAPSGPRTDGPTEVA